MRTIFDTDRSLTPGRSARLRIPAILLALPLAWACGTTGPDETGTLQVGFVEVSPFELTLISPGRQATVSVGVRASDGSSMLDATIDWSSSDPSVLEVSPTGAFEATVRGVGGGVAWARAEAGSVKDSARVSVHSDGVAYVVNGDGSSDHDVTVIDLATDTVADRISFEPRRLSNGLCSGGGPGLAFGPDARHAFVVSGFTICMIDVVLGHEVALGGDVIRGGSRWRMWDMRRTTGGSSLWVTSFETIAEIDANDLSTRRLFAVGDLIEPRLFRSIDLTPDGGTALVTFGSSLEAQGDTLHLIDLESGGSIRSIDEVGPGAWDVRVHPDGEIAYVASGGRRFVSVIDIPSGTVTSTIGLGVDSRAVDFTPDGRMAFVANRGGTVSVIDVAQETLIETLPVGDTPDEIAVTPDGSKAYVANRLGNTVTVIDVESLTVLTTIPVGRGPARIAFAR